MNRRQTNSQTNRHSFNYQQQFKDLKHQIQLKNQQIQDLNFQIQSLRKQQSIWHHLDYAYEKSNIQQERKTLCAQNEALKSQIVSMVKEIEEKDKNILQQAQKITNYKEYGQKMAKLSQRSQSFYKKEIQGLQKQKQKFIQALSQCEVIARQMQQYYMAQVQKSKAQIQQQKNVIIRLQSNKNMLQQQLNKKQQQIQQLRIKSSNRNIYSFPQFRQKQKQNDFNQLLKRQTLQKKFELMLSQTRQKYQKQTNQLKQHIKLLNLKLESMQDSKSCYQNMTSSILTHSKFAMSTSNNDSFRFNPNNSFSSSIKESLTRRDPSTMRTPSKSSRNFGNGNQAQTGYEAYGQGYLIDRTNL